MRRFRKRSQLVSRMRKRSFGGDFDPVFGGVETAFEDAGCAADLGNLDDWMVGATTAGKES